MTFRVTCTQLTAVCVNCSCEATANRLPLFLSLFLGNDCDSLESFTLHDGYTFLASSSSRMRTELGISLQHCLRLCLQNRQCRAINYDGHSCQLIEGQSSALRQIGRLDGPLRSFGICAEKICITGMYFGQWTATFITTECSYHDNKMENANLQFGHTGTPHTQTKNTSATVDLGHWSTFLATISPTRVMNSTLISSILSISFGKKWRMCSRSPPVDSCASMRRVFPAEVPCTMGLAVS